MMQGDLIRHYGEHMVTAKVGAAHCGPALPERARRLGCFLPRSWGGGAASGVSWLPEERVALLSMSVVLLGWASTAAVGRDLGPRCPFSLCKVSYLRADPPQPLPLYLYTPPPASIAVYPSPASIYPTSSLSGPPSTPS